MALHTDQGHPHIHIVVRAKREQGERLNIRKVTLRERRRDFAQYLRDFGNEANATERAVRGEVTPRKRDYICQAMLRGESTHYHEPDVDVVALEHWPVAPTRPGLRNGAFDPMLPFMTDGYQAVVPR
jgi:hypothetical protein